MGEDLEHLLTEGNDDYQNTPEEEDTPTGPSFMMQLQNAELAVCSTGKAIIKRHHLIADGEYQGVSVYDNLFPLIGGFGTRRFKGWCRVMGFEPPESSKGIEETVAEIVASNPVYMGSIAKSTGGFTNVTATKLLDEESGGAPPPAARPAASRKTTKAEDPEPEPEIGKGDTVTFTDEDGDEVTGTVTKVKNGKADVDTPNADYEGVSVEKLTAEPPEPEPEPEPQADDELVDLIALAQAAGIDVSDNTDRDDLVQIIKTHKWVKSELADDEVVLLEGVGVKFKAQARPTVKPKAAAKKTAKKTAKRR